MGWKKGPESRSQGEGHGVEGMSVEMPEGPGFISGVSAPDENLSFQPNYPKAFDGNKTPSSRGQLRPLALGGGL